MRLFIAINFEEKVKLKLNEAQNYLKKYAAYGNFSSSENLHLTLVFLGETEAGRLFEIKNAIDNINIKPFKICISGLERFKKEGGDIYCIGIKPSFNLTKLHNNLLFNLKGLGLNFPAGRFSPHITIARQTSLNKDFNKDTFNHDFGNIYSEVKKINLLESVKVSDKQVYTEIYFKKLADSFNNPGN